MKIVSKELLRIIISCILFFLAFLFKEPISLIIFVITYILIGYETFIRVIKNFGKGIVFDENFLMTIATVGAFVIGENMEAVAVMLFYQIGEYINDLGVDKSKEEIKKLIDLRSDKATLIVNGKEKEVKSEQLRIDDMILIRPGEIIPVDGILVDGKSSVDTSSITGESIPKDIKPSSLVYSGYINLNGAIMVRVTTLFKDSMVSKIFKVIEESDVKKSNTQKFITRFAKVYTPIVVITALLIFIIPTFWLQLDANTWLYRSLVFLVASCPCALILSIPLGFFCGIGLASKRGILIKSSSDLEKISKIKTFVFDKTGTLTKGVFRVLKVNKNNIDKEELMRLAAYGEFYSNHPIATSIKSNYNEEIDASCISKFKEEDGGISVVINHDRVLIGNYDFLLKRKIKLDVVEEVGSIVYIAKNREYVGNIIIGDEIKEDAFLLVDTLKKKGISNLVVLSGDNEKTVQNVCEKLKIEEYAFGLKPIDKKDYIYQLKKDGPVCFVGDGINDAVVLLESDLGISMGAIGSDAAIEASDMVIMNDNPSKIIDVIEISQYTNKIVWENIIFALLIKMLVLILGILGISSILMAVFADIGVTIITIFNSLRIFRRKTL